MSRLGKFLLCFGGLSLVLWAAVDPRFRNAQGYGSGAVCLPISAGVALTILGAALSSGLRLAAFWFALALVGQAVALQMVEAGPFIRYQHYKSLGRLFEESPALAVFLGVQCVLVIVGLKARWASLRGWLSDTFRWWQLVAIAVVFILTSATVSRDLPAYLVELAFAAGVQAINLAAIVLMALALPEETLATLGQRFDRCFGAATAAAERHSGGIDRYASAAALWVLVWSAAFSYFVYQAHPHIEDEVLYFYQARYLAQGALTVAAPPVPAAFSFYMIPHEAERWFSIFPPGWPAMLAAGVSLGIPWLVNPLLASLNVLLSYLLLQELYSRRSARLALPLLCLSPWFVFMGMNFMAHTFTLTCALAATLGIVWSRKSGKAQWAFFAGAAVGVVSLIRPLDGFVMAGLLGLWAIGVGAPRLKFSALAAFALGTLGVGAAVMPYNRQITGNATIFPLMAYYDKYHGPNSNALGFGPERGLNWPIDAFPGHTPLESLINANLNLFSINVELFGWISGSLLLVMLLIFSGTLRRPDYSMLAVLAAVCGALSFYWFSGGPDFGARYWYLMAIPLVALSVRGIEFLESALQRGSAGSAKRSPRAIAAVLALSALALVNFFPWRAVDKYYHYLGMRPDIRYLAQEHRFGKSLVLIRGAVHPDYQSAWVYNPLDPQADAPIYAWDKNPQVRAQVLQAYADRPVWIVNGPSVTRAGYQILAGPLSARELAAQGS